MNQQLASLKGAKDLACRIDLQQNVCVIEGNILQLHCLMPGVEVAMSQRYHHPQPESELSDGRLLQQ
jgi:hypothetical protein